MDKSYEKHVEDLIKVRSEIRKAAENYCKKDFSGEAYRMIRAAAIADALGVEQDEFYLHKRLVEKEFGMVDTLLMAQGDDVLIYGIWQVVTVYNSTNSVILKNFRKKEDAFLEYNKILEKYWKMDNYPKTDIYGLSYEECKENYDFTLGDNNNHEEIRCYVTKEKVR